MKQLKALGEIEILGIVLSLTHLLTALFYKKFHFSSGPVCWSFFDRCGSFWDFIQNNYDLLLSFYAAFSLFCAFLFVRKQLRYGKILFAILTVFKLVVHMSDYRYMGNYHYMSHIINFTFLVMKDPRDMIRLWLVVFYFSAGLLKLNTEWLSGAALTSEPFVKGKILEVLLALAVFLELVFVFLLLGKKNWFYWGTFAALCIFHLFSWHIVGYFYPSLMLLLISSFVIIKEPFQWPKQLGALAAFAVFAAFQAYPLLFEPNSSLNGRGRVLALNMLDAKSDCEARFFIKYKNQTVEYYPSFDRYGTRIHCDPLVVIRNLEKTCLAEKKKNDFVDIDLDLQTRRTSNPEPIEQMTFKNVCERPLKVGFLGGVSQP